MTIFGTHQEIIKMWGALVKLGDLNNIVESVITATSQPWNARYKFEEDSSPSSVVINAVRTQITNFSETR